MEPSETSRVEKPPGHNEEATQGISPPSAEKHGKQAFFAARHFFSLSYRRFIEFDLYKPLRPLAREGNIPVTIVEVGWFPQRKWYHLDHLGINAKSSLMTDDLGWISDEHL